MHLRWFIIIILFNYTNRCFSYSKYRKAKSEASHVLKLIRNKRNHGFFGETFGSSDLESECYEEKCDYEEVKEYFDNYTKNVATIVEKFMKYKNIKKWESGVKDVLFLSIYFL